MKAQRKLKGFTQSEVAERAGIARTTYLQVENGSRGTNVEVAVAIGRVLNKPVEYLFSE